MNAKTVAALVLTASTLLGAVSAEAGNKGEHHNQSHKHFKHKDKHYRPHFGVYVGEYGYARECRYLERKAYYTGSPYWWRKYKRCVVNYY